MVDAFAERTEKRYYRDCYGNRAIMNINGTGVILVINPGCKSDESALVEFFDTLWGAVNKMHGYSGGTWTEVSRNVCQ